MYSRSYNKNAPFTVPKQYSGVAFSRPRASDETKAQLRATRPPVGYSPEVSERLYAPEDLPKISVPTPPQREDREEEREEKPEEKALEAHGQRPPSFLTSLGALGDDTLMLIALILLLSGCEDAGDTVILLILLLLLG